MPSQLPCCMLPLAMLYASTRHAVCFHSLPPPHPNLSHRISSPPCLPTSHGVVQPCVFGSSRGATSLLACLAAVTLRSPAHAAAAVGAGVLEVAVEAMEGRGATAGSQW
ncbi:unnamed protein product [Closterium sp. NIES-65]|nr:unnamed protein product [Closterium sp. NIES-65]